MWYSDSFGICLAYEFITICGRGNLRKHICHCSAHISVYCARVSECLNLHFIGCIAQQRTMSDRRCKCQTNYTHKSCNLFLYAFHLTLSAYNAIHNYIASAIRFVDRYNRNEFSAHHRFKSNGIVTIKSNYYNNIVINSNQFMYHSFES